MNEHALDAMIYAWQVMKKKEESSMEGIFLGKIDLATFDPRSISLSFRTKHLDQHVEVRKELDYDCDYVLVKADDVITTNDEILKLRDEVKRLTDECADWKARYKTTRTLREAYITGVEKDCESLREERDALKEKVADLIGQKERLSDRAVYWNNRFTSVMADFGKVLEANGVTFEVKNIDNDGNWDVGIDIPELNRVKAENDKLRGMITTNFRDLLKESGINFELTQPNGPESLTLKFDIPELNETKAKVADLEKKLKAAESKEAFWRGRKEEEEDYHHYWMYTFDRAVKQAAEKGIHIGVRGTDEDCNTGIVTIDNMKAEELEKRVVTLEKTNKNLDQKIGAADNALEYWNNTYNDIVIAGKEVGVKIDIRGKKPDINAGFVYVTNEKALGLVYEFNGIKQKQDKKWQAMLDALEAKGVEVIYMGEEDEKPVIDVKIPAIDILRKDYIVRGQTISDLKREIEALKSKTVATCTVETGIGGNLKFIFTYMDGHNEPAHINCLCKNYVDAESISHGTVPKCSNCAHYMHNPSRFAHDWCYMPIPKEGGAGYIRRLNKEEVEGPACSDFKARKE